MRYPFPPIKTDFDIRPCPQPLFKYIDAEHAHFLESGCIKIGSAHLFRLQNDMRSDTEELTAIHLIRYFRHFGYLDPFSQEATILRGVGIDIGRNVRNVHIENYQFINRSTNFPILCFSTSGEITANGCADKAVFELSSADDLISIISEVRPDLSRAVSGLVEYGSRILDPFTDGIQLPNPWRKPASLAWEIEARIAWYRDSEDPCEYQFIHDDRIAKILRRIR